MSLLFRKPAPPAGSNKIGLCPRLLVICLVGLLAGCGQKEPPTPKLLLYSGAGIRPATEALADRFQQLHHVEIECDFAGSAVLLNRMELTRRGDLFMPGDIQYIHQAEDMGMVEDYKMGCYFLPVILVQQGNPSDIKSLQDLTKPGIRLALGNARSCAIGRRTLKLFEKNDIAMEQVEPNVVMECMTVTELGSEVKLGMVDAAIVWDAVAAHFPDDCEVVRIPHRKNVISKVAAAALSSSRYPELTEQFLDFVSSKEGEKIFRQHHFTVSLDEGATAALEEGEASSKKSTESDAAEEPLPDDASAETAEQEEAGADAPASTPQ